MIMMKKIFQSGKRKLVLVFAAIFVVAGLAFKPVEDYFEISKNLDIFVSLFREVNMYYVDETKPGEMMKTGIDAMLEGLDPYTNYISESEIEDYRFITTGEYGGIGATIRQMDGNVVITEPYEGYPAQKSGIRAGDIIKEVDGKAIGMKNGEEINHLLRGQAGTSINLGVSRGGESQLLNFELKREEIKVKNVPYYGMLNEDVGYIKLTGFTENAAGEVKDALLKLKSENNCKRLVLDLRDNPGGLLREAVEIVNLFTEKGIEVVFTKGKVKDWDKSYKTLNPPVDNSIPLVVLVNKGSASASEIVSGALQDLDRAVVIGQRTFGKGLVQQTKPLTYGAQVKITVAKYYVPSGRCIQALDYSNRNDDGSVEKVSDSLITAFKTKGGRIVYDGAGINPDVLTKTTEANVLLNTLLSRNFIFDFATLYTRSGNKPANAKSFQLSDADYQKFIEFMKDKNFEYSTKSEKDLFSLMEDAKHEKYFEDIKSEYNSLKQKMENRKKDDLMKLKEEIIPLLEDEIVSRYFYQSGRLEAGIKYDKEITEALKIVGDVQKTQQILSTIEKPTKPFNPNKKF
jgi:carboxyl-terminal processing protease